MRAIAKYLYGRPGFYLALLLLPPLLWLGTVYLGSLLALLMQSFSAIDEFTARIVPPMFTKRGCLSPRHSVTFQIFPA